MTKIAPQMGRDLQLDYRSTSGFFENGDLASGPPADRSSIHRDLYTTDSIDNLTQAVANRLKTRKGELAPLGHPEYGSRHHELYGEPNIDRTRNLIKLYVLQALKREHRIEKVVEVKVMPEHDPPRDVVRIEISARVIGETAPLNLVLPFCLETSI
ncbi:MAG: GPW/gp25 family protein [Proteobacteria bacterium]|nr:GPW/gp25 family protein [Pseudomonadota bacterium]